MGQRWVVLGAVGAVGCASTVPEPLEAITIGGQVPAGPALVAVVGDGRDYQVTSEDGAVDLAVHTPSEADLAAELDGRTLTFESDAAGAEDIDGQPVAARHTTWRASDDVPRWLSYRGGPTTLVDEWFGAGFAAFGEAVGRERPGGGIVREHYTVVLQADAGEVELLAGEVATIEIDGALWRVGVVAAFHDEERSNSKCPASGDTLEYELLRVEAEVGARTVPPAAGRATALGPVGCG